LVVAVVLTGCAVSVTPAGTSAQTSSPAVGAARTSVPRPTDAVSATVERVVDGDTLVAGVDGVRERIRLLRIDAPELGRDGTPAACLAERASSHLAALLPTGAEVHVATDVEKRDRFGRLLAHVWDDDLWVNGAMLDAGLATAVTIPPNVALDDEVRAAQAGARDAGRGLWDPGAC
jgi:micrococcal nuclease